MMMMKIITLPPPPSPPPLPPSPGFQKIFLEFLGVFLELMILSAQVEGFSGFQYAGLFLSLSQISNIIKIHVKCWKL